MFKICLINTFLVLVVGNMLGVIGESQNLTSIRWAHAVNSQALLEEALNGKIDMIEADIVLGTLYNDTFKQPVMGHPPANTSDITLFMFLDKIRIFNANNNIKKGVKLDFKSTEVFQGSINILKTIWNQLDFPIWINADILKGPVDNVETIPVDPNAFFTGCKEFPTAVLSTGWTTLWGPNYHDGFYTEKQINDMINTITENKINATSHEITFPLRAGIAANSLNQVENLMNAINKTNNATITIWSSANDNVNVNNLRNFIFNFGLNKIYLDVPEELERQLNLGNRNFAIKMNLNRFNFLITLILLIIAKHFYF